MIKKLGGLCLLALTVLSGGKAQAWTLVDDWVNHNNVVNHHVEQRCAQAGDVIIKIIEGADLLQKLSADVRVFHCEESFREIGISADTILDTTKHLVYSAKGERKERLSKLIPEIEATVGAIAAAAAKKGGECQNPSQASGATLEVKYMYKCNDIKNMEGGYSVHEFSSPDDLGRSANPDDVSSQNYMSDATRTHESALASYRRVLEGKE